MGKTRNTYKEGTKLTDPFPLKTGNFDAETYLDALEQVTYTKVVMGGNYPEGICPMCVSFLKMTLEFVMQFKKSQKQLQKMSKSSIPAYESIRVEYKYSSNEEDDYFTDELHCDQGNSSNVELIIKNKKFNLNEVLVVEDTEKKINNFGGFIKNLGKEITATMINNKNSLNNFAAIKPDPEIIVKNEPMEPNEQNSDENDDCKEDGEETIEFIVESLEEYEDQGTSETFNANENEDTAQSEEIKIIEDNSSDADSQKSENQKLEYIEIDMFDKEAIESLIIDRSKLPDNKRIAVTRKIKSKDDDKDEFLKELKFPCEICKNVYQTKYSLKGHMRRAHSKRNEKTFTCDICGAECRTRSVFVNHKLKHFDKKFKCETCGKAYSTKAHLKVHMTAHSNMRPYLCNVCGKDFNYANALTYHMRLHTGEKNYHCEYCPKRFRMINALNRHLRTHTGEKPYKCQFCGRDFSSRGEVVCHEYIHTGYRPYHCKYCKKGFSKTHNLKIHLLSHGGPYHCQFCNKTFIEENILTMHHKISHKDMMTDEQTENADEDTPDSQDGAYIPYEDFSQDGNVEIELIEETSELEDQMEDDNSSE